MRLFLALDLTQEVREEISGLQARLRQGCPGWRWLPVEGIHLTFRFLGEVRSEAVALQRRAWLEAARSCAPVSFRLGETGAFPSLARPRVLWIGVAEESPPGGLTTLASAIEDAARREGFAPEDRPFHPHLTLARAARGERPTPPGASAPRLGATLGSYQVALFLSELGPKGARYTRLEVFPLGGSTGGA